MRVSRREQRMWNSLCSRDPFSYDDDPVLVESSISEGSGSLNPVPVSEDVRVPEGARWIRTGQIVTPVPSVPNIFDQNLRANSYDRRYSFPLYPVRRDAILPGSQIEQLTRLVEELTQTRDQPPPRRSKMKDWLLTILLIAAIMAVYLAVIVLMTHLASETEKQN